MPELNWRSGIHELGILNEEAFACSGMQLQRLLAAELRPQEPRSQVRRS